MFKDMSVYICLGLSLHTFLVAAFIAVAVGESDGLKPPLSLMVMTFNCRVVCPSILLLPSIL